MGDTRDERDRPRDVAAARSVTTEAFGFVRAASDFARGKSSEDLSRQAVVAPSRVEAPARRVSTGAGASIISINAEITGSITSPDELNIYGAVDGGVRAQTVTICEGGRVKGEVTAEVVIVRGTVEGLINGQRVELCAGAVVRGDINHSALGIDTTAIFEGAAKRSFKPEAQIQQLPAKSKAAGPAADNDTKPLGELL